MGFTGGSVVKSVCNAGDLDSIPGLGRSPGGGHGNPLQYSCLKNSMDVGAWGATAHGVTRESDMTEQLTLSLSGYLCTPSRVGVPNLQDLMPDDRRWS